MKLQNNLFADFFFFPVAFFVVRTEMRQTGLQISKKSGHISRTVRRKKPETVENWGESGDEGH